MSGIGGVATPLPPSRLGLEPLDTGRAGPVGDSTAPPPVGSSEPGASSSIPVLSLPEQTDASTLMNRLMELKIKLGDEQQKGSMETIKGDSKIRKTQADEVAKKTLEAMEKQASASKNALAMKILGWVAVALTVVAAVAISIASFGTATAVAALVCAAVVVTMVTLNETGQMDKMQNAIQKSLEDGGMGEDEAKKWAIGLNMGIQLTVMILTTVATLGAGASGSVGTLVSISANIAKTARMASLAADASGAGVTIAQQGMAIDSAVKTKEASDLSAEALDFKALMAKLQASMEDEQDRFQEMIQQANAAIAGAMKILSGQANSQSDIIHHMG